MVDSEKASRAMNSYEKATLMAQERSELRTIIVSINDKIYKVIFMFITIISGTITAIAGKYTDYSKYMDHVLFGLSQIIILLILFSIILLQVLGLKVGYIRAIDEKINKLSGEDITIWESHISMKLIAGPKGAYFWTSAGLYLIGFIVYVIALTLSRDILSDIAYYSFLIAEIVIPIVILVSVFRESNRAYKMGLEKFNLT